MERYEYFLRAEDIGELPSPVNEFVSVPVNDESKKSGSPLRYSYGEQAFTGAFTSRRKNRG